MRCWEPRGNITLKVTKTQVSTLPAESAWQQKSPRAGAVWAETGQNKWLLGDLDIIRVWQIRRAASKEAAIITGATK